MTTPSLTVAQPETDARVRRALAANQHRARVLEQRRAALDLANIVHMAIARIKDEIHADPSWTLLRCILTGEQARPHAGRAPLLPLLRALPGVGPGKARAMIRAVRPLTPNLRTLILEDLTERERLELAAELARRRRTLSDEWLATIAARPRPQRPQR